MTVAIVGVGPAGLSAALFTAKNGLDTLVFDTDSTWVHSAHLFNYLGIESIGGDDFLEIARHQVDTFGADRHQGEKVTEIESTDGGFAIESDSIHRKTRSENCGQPILVNVWADETIHPIGGGTDAVRRRPIE